MTSSCIAVKNFFASHGVDDGLSLNVSNLSAFLVASSNQLANRLDGGAIAGALCGQVFVTSQGLNSALTSLFRICHFKFPCLASGLVTFLPVATCKSSGYAGDGLTKLYLEALLPL